jgi:quercetin dioxygenase-like cupin family protein|tara:strand:+ start:1580 stop:2068 length:489 start_codon:yes stop_codon:yes gene_type:complete
VANLLVDDKLKAQVTNLENTIKKEISEGNATCAVDQTSLRHFFVPAIEEGGCNLYTRELTVPKGMSFTGQLHRHAHMVFLMQGEMLIVSEQGKKYVKAPYTWVAPSGAKRAFHALQDSILTNVHLTSYLGKENLEQIEEEVIAPSYTSMGLDEPDLKILLEK